MISRSLAVIGESYPNFIVLILLSCVSGLSLPAELTAFSFFFFLGKMSALARLFSDDVEQMLVENDEGFLIRMDSLNDGSQRDLSIIRRDYGEAQLRLTGFDQKLQEMTTNHANRLDGLVYVAHEYYLLIKQVQRACMFLHNAHQRLVSDIILFDKIIYKSFVKIETYEDFTQETGNSFTDIRKDINRLKDDYDTLQNRVETMSNRFINKIQLELTDGRVATVEADHKKTADSLRGFQTKLEDLIASFEVAKGNAADLKKQVDDVEITAERADRCSAVQQVAVDLHKTKISAVEENIKTISKNIKGLDTSVQKISDDMALQVTKDQDLNKVVTETSDEVSSFSDALKKHVAEAVRKPLADLAKWQSEDTTRMRDLKAALEKSSKKHSLMVQTRLEELQAEFKKFSDLKESGEKSEEMTDLAGLTSLFEDWVVAQSAMKLERQAQDDEFKLKLKNIETKLTNTEAKLSSMSGWNPVSNPIHRNVEQLMDEARNDQSSTGRFMQYLRSGYHATVSFFTERKFIVACVMTGLIIGA